MSTAAGQPKDLRVDLPGGGSLEVRDTEEVEFWNTSAQKYIEDHNLTKQNDLVLLGAILSQSLAMYRAQRDLNDEDKSASAITAIGKASEQIRDLEKALGIDKRAREAGGQHTVSDYISTLKRAAHEKGVHISKRITAYEAFIAELSWRVRLLRNGDVEDRSYHSLSEASVVEWIEGELAKLVEADKTYAKERHRVFIGRL